MLDELLKSTSTVTVELALQLRFIQKYCEHAVWLPDEITSGFEGTQVLRCTKCGKRSREIPDS